MEYTVVLHLIANTALVAVQAVMLDPVSVQLPLVGESPDWTAVVPFATACDFIFVH
jgi:hypothetical protein